MTEPSRNVIDDDSINEPQPKNNSQPVKDKNSKDLKGAN